MRLTEDDFQLYYNGCCNATFWPLFHSMPDRWEIVVIMVIIVIIVIAILVIMVIIVMIVFIVFIVIIYLFHSIPDM